jgi:hypothetical protein
VPVRLRLADPALVAAAVRRFRDGSADDADLRFLVKHLLAVLVHRAPGGAVEVRVPPYAAAQAIGGTTHKRGTPPAVVEVDAATWVALAVGDLEWADAERAGLVTASGERSDLSSLLPLQPVPADDLP